MLSLNVVGAGRLGKSLARLMALQGVPIAGVFNRSAHQAALACAFIGQGRPCISLAQLPKACVHLLAVPDDALSGVTASLLQTSLFQPGDILFHCSGSKSSMELRQQFPQLDELQVALASVHPLFSFADPERAIVQFPDTICSMEGDAFALEKLRPLFEQIGAKLVTIDANKKMLYHAGSVFASNYLVSLLDTAMRAYVGAGVPQELAQTMAHSLAQSSLNNVFEMGAAAALTGPIKRGDLTTVRLQEQVVRSWNGVRGDLYTAFIAPTGELANSSS